MSFKFSSLKSRQISTPAAYDMVAVFPGTYTRIVGIYIWQFVGVAGDQVQVSILPSPGIAPLFSLATIAGTTSAVSSFGKTASPNIDLDPLVPAAVSGGEFPFPLPTAHMTTTDGVNFTRAPFTLSISTAGAPTYVVIIFYTEDPD